MIIGETKEQVFDKAANAFQNETIFVRYPIDERGFGPHKEFNFTSPEFQLIEDRNTWKFYYDKGYFSDLLKLTFKEERLIKIYRHRQKFELP